MKMPLTFYSQGFSLFNFYIQRSKQIIYLRGRKFRLFDVTGYNINLVACGFTEISLLNVASEKLRIRKVTAIKFALTKIAICKGCIGYIVALERELFKVHIGEKVILKITA